jgi:outer membrane protein assembly factor BamB/tetratricopeptide (TPR) repeat protein
MKKALFVFLVVLFAQAMPAYAGDNASSGGAQEKPSIVPLVPDASIPKPIENKLFLKEATRSDEFAALYEELGRTVLTRDWDKALAAYERLLEFLASKKDEHYVVEVEPDRYVSAESAVLDRMRNLPPEALQTFREKTDRAAARLFEAAVSTRSEEKLRQVEKAYFMSAYGPRASMLLADAAISRGDWDEAADLLKKICFHSSALAPEERASALALLAETCDRRGAVALRDAALLELEKSAGNLMFRGRTMTPKQAAALVRARPRAAVDKESSYAPAGGQEITSSSTPGFMPGAIVAEVEIPGSAYMEKVADAAMERGIRPPAPVYPIVRGGRGFAASLCGICAFDVQNGAVLWKYEVPMTVPPPQAAQSTCAPAVGGQLVFAALYTDRPEGENASGWDLYALDAATGKPVWRGSADAAGIFNKAAYISSPLVYENHVLAAAVTLEREACVYLFALDARTGKLEWKTFIASAMTGDPYRLTTSGIAPSIGEGCVYCVTNLGVAAAVNERSGEIAWIVKYTPYTQAMRLYLTVRDRRWSAQPAFCMGGRLFAVPQDSVYMLALDAASGKREWRMPRSSDAEFETTIAVSPGKITLAGSRLSVLDGISGRMLWSIPSPGRLDGRPFSDGKKIFLPCEDAVYSYSVETGALAEKMRWLSPGLGGNLVFAGGRCVAGGRGVVRIYEQFDESVKRLGGGDARETAQLADMLARRGELEKALSLVKKLSDSAEGVTARGEAVLVRIAAAYSEMGETVRAREIYKDVASAAGNDALHVEALFQTARLSECAGDYAGAAAAFGEIIKRQITSAYPPDRPGSISAIIVAEHNINRLLSRRGSAVYAELEKEAAILEKQSPGPAGGPRFEMVEHSIIRLYPNSAAAQAAYFNLVSYYDSKNDSAISARILEEFLGRYPHSPRRIEAFKSLFKIHETAGDPRRARDLLERAFLDGGEQAVWADGILAQKPNIAVYPPRILGEPLKAAWQTPIFFGNRQPRCLAPSGKVPKGLFFMADIGYVECRYLDTGAFAWRCNFADFAGMGGDMWDMRAVSDGRMLAVAVKDKILYIDAFKGEIAWFFDIKPPAARKPGVNVPVGQFNKIEMCADKVVVSTKFGSVVAIDKNTGKPAWEADVEAPISGAPVIFGNEAFVFIETKPSVIALDLAKGGKTFELAVESKQGRLTSMPIIAGALVLLQTAPGDVQAFSCEKKQILWKINRTDFIREIVLAGGRAVLVMGGGGNNYIAALDASTGREFWAKKYGGREIVKVLADVGRTYVAIHDPQARTLVIEALDVSGGAVRWAAEKSGMSYRGDFEGIALCGEYIMAPHYMIFFSELALVSADTGAVQGLNFNGAEIQSATAFGDTLVVSTNRNLFGFRMYDYYREVRRMLALADRVTEEPNDFAAVLQLASVRFMLGFTTPAKAELVNALLSEAIVEQYRWYGRLESFLEAVVEAEAAEKPAEADVPYIRHAPSMDGEAGDDYPRFSTIELGGPSHVMKIQGEREGALPWLGKEDLSGRMSLSWDKKNFYLYIDVDDNIMRPHDRDSDKWVGDILLIAIDFRDDGGQSYRGDDELLSLALVLPRKREMTKEEEEDEEKRKPEGEYFVKRKDDNSGLVYEVAMPWSLFKAHGSNVDPEKGPSEGFAFGMDVIVVDDDIGSGATKALSWSSGVKLGAERMELWRGYVPDRFAKVRLIGGPADKGAPDAPKPKGGEGELKLKLEPKGPRK